MRGLKRILGFLLVVLSLSISYTKAQAATAEQYLAAGNQMYAAKNYAQAIQYLNAAIKLNPGNASAYQLTGNCYFALGNKKYALAYYQRASAMQPANAQLAQFVQNLAAQVNTAPAAPGMGLAAANPLSQGAALFQQKQYEASLPYFRQAIQQNPNDYRGYYYSGYAYYMTRNAKLAAFYFGVANAKQPNASIKAYADRIKGGLPSEEQQWVDDQVSKYTQGAVGVASGSGKKSDIAFGFHIRAGGEYILADPAQITDKVTAAGSVSLAGLTPNIIPFPELEPFIQIGNAFEINLAFGYFPVGNLSYTTFDYSRPSPNALTPGSPNADVWSYTYNTNIITADLGVKVLFGDDKTKGYLGLSGGISPISMTFTKLTRDNANTTSFGTDDSSGTYSTMAINGQAMLGIDLSLGKGIALGPYVGFRYLNATNFQKAGQTLVVDTQNATTLKPTGAVGLQNVGVTAIPGSANIPLGDTVAPLTLDFSGIIGGIDLTFSF